MAVYELGIDEVGRGALAGPVVVVAAALAYRPRRLKDSKKLSAKQRESWYVYFLEHPTEIVFSIARVYPREIEKRNISQAANLAAFRAYTRLMKELDGKNNRQARVSGKVFLDGGLFLKNKKWQVANVGNAQTIVKADEKIAAVAVASIIAKVHRDKFMSRLAKKYPRYGLELHKGYGTAIHRAAIAKHGPCEIHRLTFIKQNYTLTPIT